MKKILFATTALVATAGVAAAEVKLSGFAEMGIIDSDALATAQFHHDLDVKFSLSGEADNGLTFGATIDLDEVSGGISNTSGPHSVFIAYGGAKLTMGDTDGAFDWAMKEVGIIDSIADDHTTHAGFSGNSGLDGTFDGQIATFSYSFDAFSMALSAEIDDTGTFDPVWGIGFKYSGELAGLDLGVGLGYQTTDLGGADASIVGLSVDTSFDNGMQAIINYSQLEVGGATADHWALGLGYTINALTVAMNYGEVDFGGGLTDDGFGLAANYDFGGGLVGQFGYGSSNFGGIPGSFDQYSLGLAMSF